MNELIINSLIFVIEGARLLWLWSWQALILLSLTWLIVKVNRDRAPAIRYQIWSVGLLSIAALPLLMIFKQWIAIEKVFNWTIIDQLPSPLQISTSSIQSSVVANGSAFSISALPKILLIMAAIFIIWLIGVTFSVIRIYLSYRHTCQLRKQADLITPASELFPQQIDLQIFNRIKLGCSSDIGSPALIGILHPMILLPAGIEKWTSADERHAIVLHEMAHYQRCDHIANLWQSLLAACFFFHPMVRYVLGQISLERELACDSQVIKASGNAEAYTEIILKLAEHDINMRATHQPAFNSSKKILERRITVLLSSIDQSHFSRRSNILILVNAIVLVVLMLWLVIPGETVNANGGENSSSRSASTNQQDAKAEQSIIRLYETMKHHMLTGDEAGFARLLSEDFFATSTKGTVLSREQVLKMHVPKQTADTRLDSVNLNDMRVRVYSDTAVVTYVAELSGLHKGQAFQHRARITDIWERNGEEWVSVASHASAITAQ